MTSPTFDAAPAHKPRPRRSTAGRTSQTKGVSLNQAEVADIKTVEDLGGVGLSEVYHRHFAPQMRAAAQLLLTAQAAGVELDRRRILDGWDVTANASDLTAVYEAESTLVLGE